jgi:predicted phosphodiesterase
MFDKISWLHISDLHLKRQSASWSQDVVLRALHKAITKLCASKSVNLVLATGDLSYSGKKDEFLQAESFFDAILTDLNLSRADLFFVAGNHDNDLSVQKYSVVGARTLLTSSGLADDLVGDVIERDQILMRQAAYRDFVSRFVPAGLWKMAPDGLAYTVVKSISPLRLSVVGLNSAWLCQSSVKDRGNIVIGERQVIDAIKAVEEERPHLVIGLIHHPTFWLCPFEHKPIEDKLRQACDFVLRGHLHETDVQTHLTGDRRCVFVAAGASFETRESRNSFNYVELDIGQGTCTITPFDYSRGEFVEAAPESIALAFRHLPKPSAVQLVAAIAHAAPDLSTIATYLACLLRGDKSEFLAFDDGRAIFLSSDALQEEGAPALKTLTRSFMSLRNLCTFSETESELRGTLTTYRDRLCDYGDRLLALAKRYSAVAEALANRDQEAKAYVPTEKTTSTHYTIAALRDLRRSSDLVTLKLIASRNADDPHPDVRREALRGLALVQAHSSIKEEQQKAASFMEDLCDSQECEAEDFATLLQLLLTSGRLAEAKERIRTAITKFPERAAVFVGIGMSLVQQTGDRAFRDELLRRQVTPGAQS